MFYFGTTRGKRPLLLWLFILILPLSLSLSVTQAKRVEESLRDRLHPIILRRTKDFVMKSILPPKYEFVITLFPEARELEQYRSECQTITERVGNRDGSSKKDSDIKGILPELMSLRLLCSNGSADLKEESNDPESNTTPSTVIAPEQAEELLQQSIKLKVRNSPKHL